MHGLVSEEDTHMASDIGEIRSIIRHDDSFVISCGRYHLTVARAFFEEVFDPYHVVTRGFKCGNMSRFHVFVG